MSNSKDHIPSPTEALLLNYYAKRISKDDMLKGLSKELGEKESALEKIITSCETFAKNKHDSAQCNYIGIPRIKDVQKKKHGGNNNVLRVVAEVTDKDEGKKTLFLWKKKPEQSEMSFIAKYYTDEKKYKIEKYILELIRGDGISPGAFTDIGMVQITQEVEHSLADYYSKLDDKLVSRHSKYGLAKKALKIIVDFQYRVNKRAAELGKDKVHRDLKDLGMKEKDITSDVPSFFASSYRAGRDDRIKQATEKMLEERVTKELGTKEKMIIHGDAYMRNMIADKQNINLIDFEDCSIGLREYDIATLLVGLDLPYHQKLKLAEGAYKETKKRINGSGYVDYRDFMKDFHRSMIARGLKVFAFYLSKPNILSAEEMRKKMQAIYTDVVCSAKMLDTICEYSSDMVGDTHLQLLKYAREYLRDKIDVDMLSKRMNMHLGKGALGTLSRASSVATKPLLVAGALVAIGGLGYGSYHAGKQLLKGKSEAKVVEPAPEVPDRVPITKKPWCNPRTYRVFEELDKCCRYDRNRKLVCIEISCGSFNHYDPKTKLCPPNR